ncbi:MAG TPA: flagellar hook-basal body complex protein FliE [Bacillota bacterium]|nr:flagellar hook-basal body complex protein FliE [Bacillota bacterium]
MNVQGLSNVNLQPLNKELNKVNDVNNKQSFAKVLQQSLEHINKVEKEADMKTEMLAAGKIDDLHDVMISAQKASITVEAATQIQRKVLDAYEEVSRMQV